jgi:hypothetical protein
VNYEIVSFTATWNPAKISREKIIRLEQEMREMDQVQIETKHRFSEGIYAREITIPKGCLLTGKVHKTVHLNIISKGDITVWTEDGMKRVQAPYTMVSQPGTKRVGFAHEETVWTTIHGTHETDLDTLERDLIEPEMIEYQGDMKWLG